LNHDSVHDEPDFVMCSLSSTHVTYCYYADRLFALLVHSNPSDEESEVHPSPTSKKLSLGEIFAAVHGGRNFHRGVEATKEKFDERFPGNVIPVRIIAELISDCSTCQKVRQKLGYSLSSENLHLKPPSVRSRIGFDVLTVIPTDKNGNTYLQV
jgi:hypothetical protein